MLRTVSPQVCPVSSPTLASSSQIAGTSWITTQWSWVFWRSVTSATSRQRSLAMRPMVSSCSEVSTPPATRMRIMK
jgi:hypothetical protein